MPTRTTMSLGVVAAATALLASACDGDPSRASAPSAAPKARAGSDGPPYEPQIAPQDFVRAIDNPLFPLESGTVYRLRGRTEDATEQETITVTDQTKTVLGVTTTVVEDVVRVDGELVEFTHDWYAQDRDGNVWYFGEDTAEYEHGKVVSRAGSWEAGVDGAQPGIIMNAEPRVTDSFRQEYYTGEAEDMYWVVETGGTVTVPHGRFDDVVHTLEWTPLEPKIVAEKFYAPGVGLIAERALSGGREVFELIDVSRD